MTIRMSASGFEHVSAQAARFETLFTKAAREYLKAVHAANGERSAGDWLSVRQTAEVADKWALLRNKTVHAVTFSMMADRIIEHPMLFAPEGSTRISHDRARSVSESVAAQAHVIGRHLEARQAALADARGLVERLRQALTYAQAALAYQEARESPGAPQEAPGDLALLYYQKARRLAASGPPREILAGLVPAPPVAAGEPRG